MFQKEQEWPHIGFQEFAKAVDFYIEKLGFERGDEIQQTEPTSITLHFHGVSLYMFQGDPGPHFTDSQHILRPSLIIPRRWRIGCVEFAWDRIEASRELPVIPPTLHIPIVGNNFSILEGIEGVETVERCVGHDYQAIRIRDCEGNNVQFFHDCTRVPRPEQWFWSWPSEIMPETKSQREDSKKTPLIIGRHFSEEANIPYQRK